MIENPIFLGGPGRSGTTLLLRVLSTHPDVTWFSGWTARFPTRPWLAAASRLNDIEPLERATRKTRRWPRPAEAYNLWDFYFPGFSAATRDWTESDVDTEAARRFLALIDAHQRWHGKPRFLTKYTGWPRFAFLRGLRPDARLLYIDRDPRATVASYVKQKWWFRRDPQGLAAMSWQQRLEFYARKYLDYYAAKGGFVAGRDYIQLHYEKLVADPIAAMRTLCEQVGLTFSDKFARRVQTFDIYPDSNEAWKAAFEPHEREYLTRLLAGPIAELGYGA